ncbi:MAG: DUF3553 domain-containing protein [Candidatus Puniceispirillaceae bacterium]
MAGLLLDYNLGDFVRHPDAEDWGIGQVQSIQGARVTVNFEHAGKQMIDASIISLTLVLPEEVGTKTI